MLVTIFSILPAKKQNQKSTERERMMKGILRTTDREEALVASRFPKILQARLQQYVNREVHDVQAGFFLFFIFFFNFILFLDFT